MAAASALLESNFSDGIRPVNLSTDLGGLADLLEMCFGDSMDESGRAVIREMRALSRNRGLYGLLNQFDRILGNLQQGFVWTQGGDLIGNTTLSPANYPREMGVGAIISNVAVNPAFRRQGIARRLLEASLDLLRQQQKQFAILQVDADNDGAQKLYTELGFRTERAFTRWVHYSYQRYPVALALMPEIWRRPGHEWDAEYALAEQVRPNEWGGLGWLRPMHPSQFRVGFWAGLGLSLMGRNDEQYVIYRDMNLRGRGGLLASARLQMPFGNADRVDLLVHPSAQGRLEEPLLNFVLRFLEDRRRSLVCEHPADDLAASDVFRKLSFEPKQTLITMRLNLN